MKNRIYSILSVSAVALALLSSCTKDELTDEAIRPSRELAPVEAKGTPVVFESSVISEQAETRSQQTGELKNSNLNDIGVFAYYHDNGTYSSSSLPDFMYNQKVTRNGSTWDYSPVKYWPNETTNDSEGPASEHTDRISFLAYAPFTAEADLAGNGSFGITGFTGKNAAGDVKVSYRVSPTDPTQSVDLLWGVAGTTETASPVNPSENSTTENEPLLNLSKMITGGKVKFKFHHALTKLDVKVSLAVDQIPAGTTKENATKVLVEAFYFIPTETTEANLLGLEGTFNLNTTYTAGSTVGWESITSRYDKAKGEATSLEIADNLKYTSASDFDSKAGAPAESVTANFPSLLKEGKPLMFIPLAGNTAYKYNVRIIYHVLTKDNEGVKDVRNDITYTGVEIPFRQDCAYSLSTIIGLNSVKFEVEAVDWDPVIKAVTMRSTNEVF